MKLYNSLLNYLIVKKLVNNFTLIVHTFLHTLIYKEKVQLATRVVVNSNPWKKVYLTSGQKPGKRACEGEEKVPSQVFFKDFT